MRRESFPFTHMMVAIFFPLGAAIDEPEFCELPAVSVLIGFIFTRNVGEEKPKF